MKIYEFHDLLFCRINEKSPESLDFTGLSGVISGVPARFERTAFRLGGGCSILLSYGDVYEVLR